MRIRLARNLAGDGGIAAERRAGEVLRERGLHLLDDGVGGALVGALLHRQADGDRPGIAELLERGVADAERIDHLANVIEIGRGREFLLDHQSAFEIDAEVEAAREGQPHAEQAQQQRQREGHLAQPDEIDVRIVGNELQEFHGLALAFRY